MKEIYSTQALRQQAIANAGIEGMLYTREEMELFAYFDRENLDETTRLKCLHEFTRGEFKVPTAA